MLLNVAPEYFDQAICELSEGVKIKCRGTLFQVEHERFANLKILDAKTVNEFLHSRPDSAEVRRRQQWLGDNPQVIQQTRYREVAAKYVTGSVNCLTKFEQVSRGYVP